MLLQQKKHEVFYNTKTKVYRTGAMALRLEKTYALRLAQKAHLAYRRHHTGCTEVNYTKLLFCVVSIRASWLVPPACCMQGASLRWALSVFFVARTSVPSLTAFFF